jgi:PilZ domain
MARRWNGRDPRRSPRVEVLMRVRGELVPTRTPILVHDLSGTGFGIISLVPFKPGETLDFRLKGPGGKTISLTARAVHSHPMPAVPSLHLSGFTFVPGVLTDLVPQVLIDQLIEAVTERRVAVRESVRG